MNNNGRGGLYVVSAPAGCGKDSILHELFKIGNNISYSVSATTRKPREGEQNGIDYYFISRNEFERGIAEGAMLEYTEYCGNYYGTPKKAVEDMLNKGNDVILKIEVEGAGNIKKIFPESTLIFILPPSLEELERRLRNRATEDEEKILQRTRQAVKEIAHANEYEYIVVNDDINKAVRDVLTIIEAGRLSINRNTEAIRRVGGR